MNGILIGALLGLITGLAVAALGAWKDVLYEPFEFRKFIRSPLICCFFGALAVVIYDDLPLLAIVGLAYLFERTVAEGWKGIVRKRPGKFNRQGRDSGWLKERLWGLLRR